MEAKLRNALDLKPEVELDISDRMTRTAMKVQQRDDGTYRIAVSGALFELRGEHYRPFAETVAELADALDDLEAAGHDLRH